MTFPTRWRLSKEHRKDKLVTFQESHSREEIELEWCYETIIDEFNILQNPRLGQYLVLWHAHGLVIGVDLAEREMVELLPRSKSLIWVDWCETSASGEHLCTLSRNGAFCIINILTREVESELSIHSPDDNLLLCSTACIAGDVLWVGMENGDILALSPVLPSLANFSVEDRMASLPPGITLSEKVKKFYYQAMNPNMKGSGIVPVAQGPFLIQPDPINLSHAPSMISCFEVEGLQFLVVVSGDHLFIMLLDAPVIPSDGHRPSHPSHPSAALPILTLIETILIGKCKDVEPLPSLSSLIVVKEDAVQILQMPWIRRMLHFIGTEDDQIVLNDNDVITCERILYSSEWNEKILDFHLLDSTTVKIITTQRQHVFDLSSTLTLSDVPASSLSRNTNGIDMLKYLPESLLSPDSRRLPKLSLTLPKIEITESMKTSAFPDKVDEDAIDSLIEVVHKWRMETLVKTWEVAEELKRRLDLMMELGGKQLDWAKKISDTVPQVSYHSQVQVCGEKIKSLQSRLDKYTGIMVDRGDCFKQMSSLRQRLDLLSTRIRSQSGTANHRHQSTINDRLRMSTDLLFRIQSQLKDLQM